MRDMTIKKMSSTQQGTMLIVDDDEFVVEILTTYFESETPWTVHQCANGNDVSHMVGSIQPNIILMDLKLPDINGIDLIYQLKRNREISNIPIIVMSGHDDLTYKRQALKAGATRYLTKPIHPAVLKNILNKYLPGPPLA